jgi:hypothetical protein
MKYWLFSCLAIIGLTGLCVSTIQAAPKLDLYYDISGNRTKLNVNGGDFSFWQAGVKLGVNFAHKYAIETYYASSLTDDNSGKLDVELKNIKSIFLRAGSDRRKRLRTYLLLGQSNVQIDYRGPSSNSSDTLTDFAWGIGAEEYLQRFKKVLFTAEYLRHFDNGDQTIYSFNLGFRFEF